MGWVSAQSLQFEMDGRVFANNEVYVCEATPTSWGEIELKMQLRNLTDKQLNVVVEKEYVKIVDGTTNTFCWGLCLGPDGFSTRPDAQITFEHVVGGQSASTLARFVEVACQRAQQERHRRHALLSVYDVEHRRALPRLGVARVQQHAHEVRFGFVVGLRAGFHDVFPQLVALP